MILNKTSIDADMDVADIEVDTRKTRMRSLRLHARSLYRVFEMFKTERGKRIIENSRYHWCSIKDARSSVVEDLMDPFAKLMIYILYDHQDPWDLQQLSWIAILSYFVALYLTELKRQSLRCNWTNKNQCY